MSDYIIPAGYGEAEHIDKKSRFIGQVQHAETEAEAMAFVEEIRKKHADATHNVWAYVLQSGAMRWSDDGEPGGTSGQPTLNVFRSAGVSDVCCVVTRYFGGILLGSGGLVRAYSRTAAEAAAVEPEGLLKLAASPLGRRMAAAERVLREFPFALLCPAERFFPGAGGEELLLQGVVDCALLEKDGIIVLDFKTDHVTESTVAGAAERYRLQVQTYAEALSRIYEMPVKAKYLYFFQLGRFVEV